MTTCLVTGGAGFIGSNLVDALLAKDCAVRVLDDFSTGRRENLAHCLTNIDLVEGTLLDPADVTRAMRGADVVYHLAALPSVPRSVADPITTDRVSVRGTLNVLLAARDAGVRRVVMASSSSIYGEQAPDSAKVETMTPRPISPYGAAKLAAEIYGRVFYLNYGLETVMLRFFNVFGPRQDPTSQYSAVIPRFVTLMLDGQQPTIFGDGGQSRDFTFVGDVTAACLLAADAPDAPGEIMNIARHENHTVNRLLDLLNEFLGATIAPIYAPPRPGEILHSFADVSRAKRILGYRPAFSFEEGLRLTVDWFRENHG